MTLSEYEISSEAVTLRVLDYVRQEHSLAWAVLAPDYTVLEVSERFRDIQWDPALEPVGRQISDIFWELVGGETGLNDVLQGKDKIFSLENINREMGNGSTIYLSIKAIPLFEREPQKGLLLLIRDTTFTSTLEQELVQDRNELRLTRNRLSQANEELQKLNRLKSLFLSIAAHDLRSPLTAMRGYADLASRTLRQESSSEAKEYLSIITSLVDSLNRLISDFLDLDILEQGNLKIRSEVCNLNPIVLNVTEVMRAVARRKNVQIEVELQDSLPSVSADPDRMQQVLFNLVSNAIKYTVEGDRIIIATSSREDSVLLIVRDHGPGIPESDLPRLFDLYHRTEEARQSRTKGLGLGLFIVKSLIDLHHGQITTRSELGKGTEFTVSIPVYQADAGEIK